MGRNCEKNLRCETVLKLIAISSELNYPLSCKGYRAEKGIILLAEEGVSAENLIHELEEKLLAVEVTNLKRTEFLKNYQIGAHKFTKYDKEEELYKFLRCKDFVPAILAEEIVPEVLSEMAFLVRITKKHMEKMGDQSFCKEVRLIRQFIRENPELMTEELDKIYSSKGYLAKCEKTSFFVSMLAAAQLYCAFFRREHNEEETNFEQAQLIYEIVEIENECRYEGVSEAAEAIQNAILHYLDTNDEWEISDVNCVDAWTEEAIKDASVVLYDMKFYYISDLLFRKSCKKVLDVLSFIELKKCCLTKISWSAT